MKITKQKIWNTLKKGYNFCISLNMVAIIAFEASVVAIFYSYVHGFITAYGDAESHLDIAKRVVSSLTPGAAQLGGIWEPLPHILMIPFVTSDFLWRTGLAGSIVSAIAYIISCIFLYKTTYLLTKNKAASFLTFLIFGLNPNILYMQTTPLNELTLIVFSVLSLYYFFKYLFNQNELFSLILAGFFVFCATLCRYDGWFLALFEGLAVFIYEYDRTSSLRRAFDRFIVFGVLAYFGIFLWVIWNWVILGDPFYFDHSQYSAKTQQLGWLAKNELPAYKNLWVSFLYYFVDSFTNTGIYIFIASYVGLIWFLIKERKLNYFLIALLLLVPFIFNTVALYIGESVIFIPSLTPKTFEYTLFNVRYGIFMISVAAVFFGYLFANANKTIKLILLSIFCLQSVLFINGTAKVITLDDGIHGLSSAKVPWPVEDFINAHYHGGLLLEDDFSRSFSITRSVVPMQDIISIGNKPYYADSFTEPQKYAEWIVIQRNDEVWNALYENKAERGKLYKYFKKVYTSPDTLIFQRDS